MYFSAKRVKINASMAAKKLKPSVFTAKELNVFTSAMKAAEFNDR
jgi:hypothetical protein